MAKIHYAADNQGFWNLWDFGDYQVSSATSTELELTYDAGALGVFDATEHPWRMVADVSGGSYATPTDGSYAGQSRAIDGVITGFTLYNDSANVIMTATGLSADLPYFFDRLQAGDGWAAFQELYSTSLKVIGTDDSGGGSWNGESIETGFRHDVVKAKGGDDLIVDHGGADSYDGGAGWDSLDYSNFIFNPRITMSGVTAKLAKGWVRGPDGMKDHVTGIEEVRGTQRHDVFIGDGHINQFEGYGGHDKFVGKGGSDWVTYYKEDWAGGSFGIDVELNAGSIQDTFMRTDIVKSIENVEGTDQKDRFIDDGKSNYFKGHDGNDFFNFSGGNDTVEGGDGNDIFAYRGDVFGDDVIKDFVQGDDRIRVGNASGMGDFTFSDSGSDLVIHWNGNTVTLTGLAGTTLDASDFIFV